MYLLKINNIIVQFLRDDIFKPNKISKIEMIRHVFFKDSHNILEL